jgi:peptidoglycan hydrolase CwlO-like protein
MKKTKWRPSYKDLWQEAKTEKDRLYHKVLKLQDQVRGLERQVALGDEEIGKLTMEIVELNRQLHKKKEPLN